MKVKRSRNLRKLWLRLAAAYVVLTVLWPFVLSTYARNLGAISTPFVRLFAYNPVAVKSTWSENLLAIHVGVADKSGVTRDIQIGLAPIRYGFSHITFLSLVIAVPGWTWRRRLLRWVFGAVAIDAFNVGVVLVNVFGDIAGMQLDYWSGDLVTTLLPRALYATYRNFASIIGAQFVPIFLWLAIFVYPRRRAIFVNELRPSPSAAKSRTRDERSPRREKGTHGSRRGL
jgi:hypothetical protein